MSVFKFWMGLNRKKSTWSILILTACFALFLLNISNIYTYNRTVENGLVDLQLKLHYFKALCRTRQEELLYLEAQVNELKRGDSNNNATSTPPVSPELATTLLNIAGSKAASGLNVGSYRLPRSLFSHQLLPHLLNHSEESLRPAYYLRSRVDMADHVIGIPTVKRDKEDYLMITLSHLIKGLSESDKNNVIILVYIGETDLNYVLDVAMRIEKLFPWQLREGIIEVLSPASSYYPDLDAIEETLGDSEKRMKWRTKQNLDAIYMMVHAQSRGVFFLLLEDDVIAEDNYMDCIKKFTTETTISNPRWFFLAFSTTGGIGKLFRSSDLIHFITYLQLFYNSMPIDWLMESYLADRVCSIYKASKECSKSKAAIRPVYKTNLFKHIGLFSSLKGKIQNAVDQKYTKKVPQYYPHVNPPLMYIRTDIKEYLQDHTLKMAYDGKTFFWGSKPKMNNFIEFFFEKPIVLDRYTFRTGNTEHRKDKLLHATVAVLPASNNRSYVRVGEFDEFGLADGDAKGVDGPIQAVKITVNRDHSYWLLMSEIHLKVKGASEKDDQNTRIPWDRFSSS